MTVPRRTTPPSVDWIRRRLDLSIRTHQSAARGFRQQGAFTFAGRVDETTDTLQQLRKALFGKPLGTYNAARPLFPRPRRRKA